LVAKVPETCPDSGDPRANVVDGELEIVVVALAHVIRLERQQVAVDLVTQLMICGGIGDSGGERSDQ